MSSTVDVGIKTYFFLIIEIGMGDSALGNSDQESSRLGTNLRIQGLIHRFQKMVSIFVGSYTSLSLFGHSDLVESLV